MPIPAGATHSLTVAVQAAQVPSALSDWFCLLCVCDMDAGINTAAQSFVAGLAPDLSDLEVCLADGETPTPWRRADGLFSQTAGSEKLWLWANAPSILSIADTDFTLYRGCAAPTGEDSGANVLPADAVDFFPIASPTDLSGWVGHDVHTTRGTTPSATTTPAGLPAVYVDQTDWGVQHFAQTDLQVAAGGTVVVWSKVTPAANAYAQNVAVKTRYETTGDARLGWCFFFYKDESARFLFRDDRTGPFIVGLYGQTYRWDWNSYGFTYDPAGSPRCTGYLNGANAGTSDPTITEGSDYSYIGWPGTKYGGAGYMLSSLLVTNALWTADEHLAWYRMTSAPASWCVAGAEESLAGGLIPPMVRSWARRGPALGMGG